MSSGLASTESPFFTLGEMDVLFGRWPFGQAHKMPKKIHVSPIFFFIRGNFLSGRCGL
jgi:hypothetical protein